MDANYITAIRTGAVAAHSIKLFAKKDFSLLGLIGLGNTVRATMKVLLSLYPERKLFIKLLKYKDQHILFANDFRAYGNLEIIFCDNYEEIVSGSDVVVSGVTVFDKDICADEHFGEGCLVVPIHTRGFGNCDLFFDKVFADDTAHVSSFKYFDRFRSFCEVSDVVNEKKTGRDNDKQRILAYNIGISVHDIYFAGKFYRMNLKSDEIDLNAPNEKFWVR
jgi:ornithine cyclodeaminase/alanine dehydrogenase